MVRIGLALLLIAAVGGPGAAIVWISREETIAVQVRGEVERVPADTALGEAARRFSLRPAAGDLLDVQGGVLQRAAYPGGIFLNGRAAPLASELSDGDRLTVIDRRSRREPTRRIFVRVRGGLPANPQFTLACAPGVEIERGQMSGKVDPQTVRPSGVAHAEGGRTHLRRRARPPTPVASCPCSCGCTRGPFFVVGRSAERYPHFVRSEYAAGMEVGNHSYFHPYRPSFRPEVPRGDRRGDRARQGRRRLARYPTIFRPPGGVFSPKVIETAHELDQRIVLWSVDSEDWKPGATAKEIAGRVLRDVRPGSIVLLHDGGGDRSQTVKALPRIVRGIRAKGLKLSFVDVPRHS